MNSLKTIFSRTLADDAVEALGKVGIATKGLDGDSRAVADVLGELAGKWDGLSNSTKQNLAVTIAGRWQLTRFLALMDNFKMGLEATETAMNSYGSAVNENAKYQDSLEAKINKLKNTFSEMSVALGESFLVNVFTLGAQALVGFMRVINGLSNTIGIFPVVFGGIVLVLRLFGSETVKTSLTLGTLIKVFTTATSRVGTFGTAVGVGATRSLRAFRLGLAITNAETIRTAGSLTVLTRSLNVAKAAWIGLGATMRAVMSTLGITAAFMAIGFLIDKTISAFTKYQEEQRKMVETENRLTKNFLTNQGAIEKLANEYENLSKKVNSGQIQKGTDEYEQYLKVQQNLYNLLPSLADNVDATGQAHLKSAKAVREELDAVEKLATAKSKIFVAEGLQSKLEEYNEEIEDIKDKIKNAGREMEFNPFSLNYTASFDENKKIIDEVRGQLELQASVQERAGLFERLAQTYAQVIGAGNEFTKADAEFVRQYIENNKQLLNSEEGQAKLEQQIKDIVTKVKVFREQLGNDFTSQQIFNFNDKQTAVLSEINQSISNGGEKWKQYAKSLEKAGFSAKDTQKIIANLKNEVKEDIPAAKYSIQITQEGITLQDLSEDGEEAFNMLDRLNDQYEQSAEKIGALNEIQSRLAQGQKITATEAQNYIGKVRELSGVFDIQNGSVRVNTSLLETLRQQQMRNYQEGTEALKQDMLNSYRASISKITWMGDEIEQIKKLANARVMAQAVMIKTNEKLQGIGTAGLYGTGKMEKKQKESYERGMAYLNSLLSTQQDAKNLLSGLDKIDNQIKVSQASLQDVGKVSPSKDKDKSGSGSKTKKEKAEEPAIPKKYQFEYDSLAALIEKEREKQKTLDETSKAYRNSVAKENQLLEKQRGLLSKIDKENKQRGKKNTRDDEIQKKLSDNSKGISETQDKLIESKTKVYDNAMTKGKELVDRYTDSLSRLREGSVEYNEVIDKIGKQELANIQYAKNKIAFLESQISGNKKLNDKQRSELKKQVNDIKNGALADAYKNYYSNLAKGEQSQIKAIRDGNDDLSDRIGYYESLKSLNEDNSLLVAENDKKIIETIDSSINGKRKEVDKLNAILRDTSTLTKKYTQDEIEEMKDSVVKAEKDIQDLLKQRKDLYKDIADTVIDSIKSQYEREKELELKKFDDQKDAMEKIKEQREKAHDDEMDRIKKEYEAKIKSIDDLADKEDYDKKLKKSTDERNQIQAKIDALALDNSYQAKAKREELLKELADKDEEISEMKNDRERDLRKEALQDAQKKAEEEASAKKDLADYEIEIEGKKQKVKYDEAVKYIDAERKKVEEKYDKLINNETEFNKIRVSIYNGTTNEIATTLQNFLTKTQENFKTLGDSIDSQLIEKLKDAQNLLTVVNGNPIGTDYKVGSVTGGGKNSTTTTPPPSTPSSGTGSTSGTSNTPKPYKLEITKDNQLLMNILPDGSFQGVRQLKKGESFEFTDLAYDAKGNIERYILPNNQTVWHTDGWTRLKRFNTGGYTGNSEGMAYLDQKEIVLNKDDTSNLLKVIDMTRSLVAGFKMKATDFMSSISPTAITNDVTLNIDQIVLQSGGKQGAMEMLDIIKGSIKTNGGLNNE